MKRERKTCPTCGKYLSNDVAALRGQVDVLTTERDNLRKLLEETNEALNQSMADLKKAKEEAKQYRIAYHSKARMCDTLQEYDHWLANRNLWQRIFNQLSPDE